VICRLFGVAKDKRDDLRRAVDTTRTPAEAAASAEDMYRIFTELAADTRLRPGDDPTTAIIQASSDRFAPLTDAEVVDTLILLLTAGHVTGLQPAPESK
jgi:cytochrome P450